MVVMSDHLALCVDRLITPESLESIKQVDPKVPSGEGSSQTATSLSCAVHIEEVHNDSHSNGPEEDKPLLVSGECRICQEEDSIDNLETPCACSGSLKVNNLKGHLGSSFADICTLFVMLALPFPKSSKSREQVGCSTFSFLHGNYKN